MYHTHVTAPLESGATLSPDRTWDEIVDEIAQLAMAEDASALTMGDCFLELDARFGARHLRKAAADAGVTLTVAKQRMEVARRIPAGHSARRLRLSFAHLAAVAETDDPSRWANHALAEQLTVRQLRTAISAAGDDLARTAGESCAACGDPLPQSGELVAIQVGRHGRRRCCGFPCAARYLDLAAEAAGDPAVCR